MSFAVSFGGHADEVTPLMSSSVRPEVDVMDFERLYLSRLSVLVPLRSSHFTAPNRLHSFRQLPQQAVAASHRSASAGND